MRLHRAARGLLDRPENPCGERPNVRARTERVVEVDSVRLSDSLAVVDLTVRKGETVHQETYRLPSLAGSRGWGMRDVRVWGVRRFTPRPPDGANGDAVPAGTTRPRPPDESPAADAHPPGD